MVSWSKSSSGFLDRWWKWRYLRLVAMFMAMSLVSTALIRRKGDAQEP